MQNIKETKPGDAAKMIVMYAGQPFIRGLRDWEHGMYPSYQVITSISCFCTDLSGALLIDGVHWTDPDEGQVSAEQLLEALDRASQEWSTTPQDI